MSSGDLKVKVQKWLVESGYPLEMKVATAFQKGGFRVFQSETYSDPDTKELREIDVIALDDFDTDEFVVRVQFTIECKVSIANPWILFLSHSHAIAAPASVAQRAANGLGRTFLRSICHRKEAQSISLFSNAGQPVAYGMTEAFGKDGNSVCFKAIMAATKAAIASAIRTSGQIPFDNHLNIFIPVVVVDGTLFHALLDLETNRPSVTQVDRGKLVLRAPSIDMPHTFVNVVSLLAIDDFVGDCRRSCDELFGVVQKYKSKIHAAIKRHPDYVGS